MQHIKSGLTKEELHAMNLRDFCESVSGTLMKHGNLPEMPLTKRGQLRSCVVGTGQWMYSKRPCSRHVRFSTIAISDLAVNYEPIDLETDTACNTFHELSFEQRQQLQRPMYELVVYCLWKDHPDKTFLAEDIRAELDRKDPEKVARWSFRRCERYQEVHLKKWKKITKSSLWTKLNTSEWLWCRDDQVCYTKYLIAGHNSLVKIDRSNNDG